MSMQRIPKKVHYCWFGKKPKPPIVQQCLASWKKHLPDYEIIEWNESNFNITICPYVKRAYNSKKFAFVTDYVRLWALYNYGGVYMDGDVEVLRNFDSFLEHRAFTGHETEELMVTATMGAEPAHPWIKLLLSYYGSTPFMAIANTPIITGMSKPFVEREEDGFTYLKDDVVIYPVETFCPFDHEKMKPTPTENTYAVHHFAGTWLDRTKV